MLCSCFIKSWNSVLKIYFNYVYCHKWTPLGLLRFLNQIYNPSNLDIEFVSTLTNRFRLSSFFSYSRIPSFPFKWIYHILTLFYKNSLHQIYHDWVVDICEFYLETWSFERIYISSNLEIKLVDTLAIQFMFFLTLSINLNHIHFNQFKFLIGSMFEHKRIGLHFPSFNLEHACLLKWLAYRPLVMLPYWWPLSIPNVFILYP